MPGWLLSFRHSLVWIPVGEKLRCVHLNVAGQAQQANHVRLHLVADSLVKPVAEPDAELVGAADRENDSSHFVGVGELLSNESQNEVFPDLVCVALGEL